MVQSLKMIRNVGKFENVNSNANAELKQFSVIYAENGRGKTTLGNILRSLGANDPNLIEDRHRLGAQHRPHVVTHANQQDFTFQNGNWQIHLPEIAVFDDHFVAQNVCSGVEIEPNHRQNLHELIIGAEGVSLSRDYQDQVDNVKEHNRVIGEREKAIPASLRGKLTVDEFCHLQPIYNIENVIKETKRTLEAAKSSDLIRQQGIFQPIVLPKLDIEAINNILGLDLPGLEQEAVTQVQKHLGKLGKDAETWIGDGMNRIAVISSDETGDICPFCKQNIQESLLISHYQGYFSNGYKSLKMNIIEQGKAIKAAHSVDIQTAFERDIQSTREKVIFWQKFMDITLFEVDTVEIARAWKAAREAILDILRDKAAAPLEKMVLSPETLKLTAIYEKYRKSIEAIVENLQNFNSQIETIKEQAAESSVATLSADLSRLELIKLRHTSDVIELCKSYQCAQSDKKKTEDLRDKKREELDAYRTIAFPVYEEKINEYLQKFLAGFRLRSMQSQNRGGGTSCTYNVLINDVSVPISSVSGASFKNTLSAGDRNALALAFFFASLDKDPNLSQKIVVIDDPMSSLDEHRSLVTIGEIIKLSSRVKQIIVLSHSKPFLCQLWDDAGKSIKGTPKSALHIIRAGQSSDIELWDVHQDCITEHDKRHKLISSYIERADQSRQREVASALRPTLESFLRVAYPANFSPGTLLGSFINICRSKLSTSDILLTSEDIAELSTLTDYSNKFHHDTNPAYATEIINDQTLNSFCQRILDFTRRSNTPLRSASLVS